MTVTYKDIPEFVGYRIGDDGSLWSCLARKGEGIGNGTSVVLADSWKRLRGGKDKDGYLKAILCKDGRRRHVRINRLVLEVFVGQPPEGAVAAHENGIRIDNRLSNLRWDTQASNVSDKKKHGTHQEADRHGGRLLDAEKVRSLRAMRSAGASLKSLAQTFGVSLPTVSAIATGRLWKSVT